MLDYDNDGFLDIYVTNYGDWLSRGPSPGRHLRKGSGFMRRRATIKTVKHFFYHNNGNMTFTNVYDKVITTEQEVVDGEDPRRRCGVPEPRDDGHGFRRGGG